MDAFKSLVQPLVGGGAGAGSGIMDGMKLVVLGGTVETARRVSSSAWWVLRSCFLFGYRRIVSCWAIHSVQALYLCLRCSSRLCFRVRMGTITSAEEYGLSARTSPLAPSLG